MKKIVIYPSETSRKINHQSTKLLEILAGYDCSVSQMRDVEPLKTLAFHMDK